MSALLLACPHCRMPENTLCRNADDSVRKRVHPRRLAAHLAFEAVIGLTHRVPYTQRWDLTRQILQTPDHSAPPTERTARALGDTEAAQHELSDVTALLEEVIDHLSGNPHGVSADQLVRDLKKARASSEHYRALLARAQQEFGLDQDATRQEADLEERLRTRRARRVQTDLLTVAGPQPPRNAPEWCVHYRQNGGFGARRRAPLPAGDLGDQLTSAQGYAPTADAAQRAVSHLVGAADHRVILHPRHHVDTLLREPGPGVLPWPRLGHLLEEDDEPAYQAFLDSCTQIRHTLAQVADLPGWLDERARNLDTTHPQCPPDTVQINPSLHPNADHTLTHVEATTWVPVESIVATHLGAWTRFSDHKRWRPATLAAELIEAVDDGHVEALARELFVYDPMRLTRVNAWAGPIYTVGDDGNGQHRAHTLRMLGLDWAPAHVTYQVPHPCLDLYGLAADDTEEERDNRAPVVRVRERAALIDGLIDRGVIDAWWDPEREGAWLWCRNVPAPWLLRNAAEAAAANHTYEATYPGALARLGIPKQVGCDARAWTAWLTQTGRLSSP